MNHNKTLYAKFVASVFYTFINISRGKLVGCIMGLTAVVCFILHSISLFGVDLSKKYLDECSTYYHIKQSEKERDAI